MEISLSNTKASHIADGIQQARLGAGSPAMDMVLTLLVIADNDTVADAMKTAALLSREHPSRILGVILGDGRGKPNVDARVRVGEGTSGESVLMWITGPLVKHAESVVLPLLLPDSPVVAWWSTNCPVDPSADPIGRLAQRRLTDAERETDSVAWLRRTAANYAPGDSDLTWTRLTTWRALLAAALDQMGAEVLSGSVTASNSNPVAALLVAWLESRLGISIERVADPGAQITKVVLTSQDGDVIIRRIDTHSCEFSVPGTKPRIVPIRRRTIAELLAEDLRRLDADEVYAETLTYLLEN